MNPYVAREQSFQCDPRVRGPRPDEKTDSLLQKRTENKQKHAVESKYERQAAAPASGHPRGEHAHVLTVRALRCCVCFAAAAGALEYAFLVRVVAMPRGASASPSHALDIGGNG